MKTFIRKLEYALNGIRILIQTEQHFRYHVAVMLIVFTLGMVFTLNKWEWLFISSAIFSVLIAEGINTSIEKICNEITLERKDTIKTVKDIAAGTVLLSVIYSIVVGMFILLPRFVALLADF